MGIRASWHEPAVLAAVEEDPFAAPIEDVGVPIRLSGTSAHLAAELVGLVKTEKSHRDRGLTCAIRDTPDTSCSACPVRGRCGDLCDLGVRQEKVLTTLAALEVVGGG